MGDSEEERGASIASEVSTDWFVSPCHTDVVNRDALGSGLKFGGVSVWLPSSDRKSESSLNVSSDPIGDTSGEET
jgi:hypothetical protein